MRLHKAKSGVIAIVVTIVVAACAGCASQSTDLTKDASLKTGWGEVLQYRVDPGWEEDKGSIGDACSYVSYKKDNQVEIRIMVDNTEWGSPELRTSDTYAGWLETSEEFYTMSQEDQAKWDEENGLEPHNPSYYPKYSDYSVEEMDSIEVDGNEWRVYKSSYAIEYSDSRFEELKEINPAIKQNENVVEYHGLLKDGEHDISVEASSENLLRAFLGSLDIGK